MAKTRMLIVTTTGDTAADIARLEHGIHSNYSQNDVGAAA